MARWIRPLVASVWLGALLVSVPVMEASAEAQTIGRWYEQTAPKWEIEFHVGGGPVSDPPDGSASLPEAGRPFTTVVGMPSRLISSYYFGDGALLLNQVNAALGLTPTITPLDPLLQSSLFEPQRDTSVGIRLSRAITRRFGVEFSIDYERGALALRPAVRAGIEATRASYAPAFSALIATGPFERPAITSLSTVDENEGSQILTTGALTINLLTSGRAIPYVTAGAGYAARTGGSPGASLEGIYQFQTLGLFAMSEIDAVSFRTVVDENAGGVFGGGLRFSISRRLGARFDLRTLVRKVSIETLLDTRSRTQSSSTPSAAAASLSAPSVQFSTNSGLGPSSLTGPQLSGFRTFAASGWQNRLNFSAGLFLRF